MSGKSNLKFDASRVEQEKDSGFGVEYKTLMEKASDPGGEPLIDGVMVLEEGKGFVDGAQMDDVNEGGDGKLVSVDVNDRGMGAYKKTRVEERTIGMDTTGSLGVMELVGRVLDGNFGMDKEERGFKHFGDKNSNSSDQLAGLNVTHRVIGEGLSGNQFGNQGTDFVGMDVTRSVVGEGLSENQFGNQGTDFHKLLDEWKFHLDVEGAGLNAEAMAVSSGTKSVNEGNDVDKMILDETSVDLQGEGSGLNGKEHVVINEHVLDGNSINAEVNIDESGFLVPNESEGAGVNERQNVVVNEWVPHGDSRNSEGDNEKPSFLIPETLGEGSGLNGKENLSVDKHVSDLNFRNDEVYKDMPGLLMPKTRGEDCFTKKEGEYYVSDLVWGKVRSHPWWPGQVFEPSAASENALKYFKRDSYLLAYFGDQTFAWNEVSKIKPFRMHFSQMEKQSNSIAFSHAVDCALDETARRVELGLSCSCLLEEVRNNIKTQVVENAGIREESSRRDDKDMLSSAASFSPSELVGYLKVLAEAPKREPDKLEFVIAKAKVVAFNRWKGRYQLPELQQFGGLLEDGRDSFEVMEGGSSVARQSKKRKSKSISQDGSSQKRVHVLGDSEWPNDKERHISDSISPSSTRLPNGEKKSGRKASSRKMSTFGEKRKPIDPIVEDTDREDVHSNAYLSIGQRLYRAVKSGDGGSNESIGKSGEEHATGVHLGSKTGSAKSRGKNSIPAECLPPKKILSKLYLAAKNPMKKSCMSTSAISLFGKLRNFTCLENNKAQNDEKCDEKLKEKLPSDSGTADTHVSGGIEDSYWTDRIIQSNPEGKMIVEPLISMQKAEAAIDVSPISVNEQERDAVVLETGKDNISAPVDEKPENSQEYSPTALILNFTDLESIPSIPNLNEIFSRYGPLSESETEILSKSKRVKVIFKNRADAEAAFSGTGKFKIFGPALVSYKLNYAHRPRRPPPTSRRNRKQTPKKDAAV